MNTIDGRKTEERGTFQILSQDGDALLRRARHHGYNGDSSLSITVLAAAQRPASDDLNRLVHEYELAKYLDPSWAIRPLELVQEDGQTILILDDPGGDLLSQHLDVPMGVERFLRLAIGITSTVGKMHQQGLVHKDLKPANILVNNRDGEIRLTGFGIASRVPRERQPPGPPQFIAGTLAYMAPEQTGRMNRSIDSRSDLYALGVTFYQMLTGSLPFSARDAMEWIHCHIARQPASPTSLVSTVPLAISAIVTKLLAKAAEDRYQTAAGLERDLQHCLADWKTLHRVDQFTLGEREVRDRLLIPEKLYGRERDVDALLAAFEGVLANGKPELVLVSGYSGIGKSAVVNELHKVLVLPRAFFASGKFDQYKRDIPYATLAQAFQDIIRQLLGQTEAELNKWRDDLIQALGSNGLLVTDVVPELKFIIGEQPTVPELPPLEAKVRFQLVFRRFIGVFARPEHPLALFFDDLQWLDAATLDLIEHLLTQPDVRYLLLVGAYRDNEVGPAHPLMRKLDAIRQSGAMARHIVLAPLGAADLTRLVTESFHCDPDRAGLLARLILEKTAGNPFFVIQFVATLVDEGLVTFDYTDARWCWDLNCIEAKGYTDNVVDLMVGKLNRLPAETRNALQQLACLGNSAGIESLSMVRGSPEEKVHADLWEARRAELVVRSEGTYKFAHDRVQEAVYSSIPEERRAENHLRIGRLLLDHIVLDQREESIFEVVSQFERGVELITSREEREKIAELHLSAGKRARVSAAYASALRYLVAGSALLTDDCWEDRHDLIFELELRRAECEFLVGDLNDAGDRLTLLSSRAATIVEQSAVECLRVDLYTTLYPPDRAVEVVLDYLKKQGIEWSPHPTNEEVRREYEQARSRLGNRAIEDLIELPLMSNSASLATLDVLTKAIAPTMLTDGNLLGLVVCRMTNLSLQYGNSDGSCQAYVWFGTITRTRFGNHKDGVRFGRLGLELIEKRNLKRFQGRTYRTFVESVSIWTEHIRTGCDLLRQAFEAANKIGDVTYAAYSLETLGRLLLVSGQPLAEVQRETEMGLEFAVAARFEFVVDLTVPRLEFIRSLRGLNSEFGSVDSEEFGEFTFDRHLAGDQRKLIADGFYCIRKLQARFYAGEYSAALAASRGAERLFSMAVAFVELAEYHFYTALCHAASVGLEDIEGRQRHVDALTTHYQQIAVWAAQCPENFDNRAALVGAEIARIEGRELEAERLYERAIHSARTNGFLNIEALANELAARFHASRSLETIANAYLREARSCYRRWGAESKVRQLEALHPHLRETALTHAAVTTIATPIEHFDFATVVEVSQALSGEMVLERLIETLMRLAIEYAGAVRGILLLSRRGQLQQQAEAISGEHGVVFRRSDESAASLPDTIVQYAMRTQEIVILDDALTDPAYSADAYVTEHRARSVLCLPLVHKSKITGVLYLENNLTPHVFTPNRTAILKLLGLQAGISLENTYLYGDLARAEKALSASERSLQLIIDTIPALVWSTRADGSVEFINQHYSDYVGLPPEQLLDWGWTTAVHPDDLSGLQTLWREVMASGKGGETEARFRRSDGEYRWLLARVNPLHDDNGNIVKWYGLNTDIEDRKRAEIHLTGEKQVLEMIASGRPLREVLVALCMFFERSAPDCHCGIYPIDLSGKTFQYGVAPSLPASYTDSIQGASVNSDDSPRGQSISEMTQVISEDIGSDARWMTAPCRAHVLDHGLRAVWSTPICSRKGSAVGTVCIYQSKAGSPSAHHREMIAHVAHLASIAIERSLAEAELRRSETFLIEGQRISLTGSFLWRLDTDELTFSEQLKHIFEFEPKAEVTFQMIRERVHPDDLSTLAEKQAQMRSGQDNPEYEIRLRMPDGRMKYMRVFGRLIRLEDGRMECLGAVQDVTRRRLAEEARDKVRSELAHVSRVVSLGALTASIAHEVNQPLASIITNGETGLRWLARSEPDLDKLQRLTRRIVDDARRAAEIIDRIRTMASRGTTKQSMVTLSEIVTEATTLLQHEFQARGVSVALDLAPDLPSVFGDRTQLQQVIVNLTMNAVQALTEPDAAGKSIAIRTQQVDVERVCCIVEDSGPGIDAEHLPRLFDSFFTTKETGMGLGLPIAQSIIEAHSGHVRADNNSALGGARFVFELPVMRDA